MLLMQAWQGILTKENIKLVDVEMSEDLGRSRDRQSRSRGKKTQKSFKQKAPAKATGYSTDFAERQRLEDEAEENVDYWNVNEDFGRDDVSGECLIFTKI